MKRRKPIARWISACRRKTCRTRAGRIAQRGGGGAVAAPMRRRGRRPIEAPGSAAPNRSGDGAPASPHCRLGHAPSPTGEVGLASLEGEERRAVLHGGAVLGKGAANQAP